MYKNTADYINKTYRGIIHARDRIRFEHIISNLPVKENIKIMDLGCGSALLFKLIKGRYNSVRYYGYDISEDIINRMKEDSSYKGCNLAVWDVMKKMPFDRYFDVVVCSEVLEHVEHPEKVLINIEKMLKVGGKAIITVPNLYAFGSLIGAVEEFLGCKTNLSVEHIHKYTPVRWEKEFLKNFKVEKEVPIYTLPYLPAIFYGIESSLISNGFIINLVIKLDLLLSGRVPLKYLGQNHLFVLRQL